MPGELLNEKLMMKAVHLQRLRAALMVDLNRAYPRRLDLVSLIALDTERSERCVLRELCYLKELNFVCVKEKSKRWRITAWGRDFLLGLSKADGIMSPAMLHSIGED